MPKSLLIFLIVALIFAIQMPPQTGWFFLLVGMPFWSVLLINGTFILIGIEVLIGQAHKAFALLPLCWFGGYEIAALLSHSKSWEIGSQIAASNHDKRVEFDRYAMRILVRDAEYFEISGLARDLLLHYDVDEVLEYRPTYRGAKYLSHQLLDGHQNCRKIFDLHSAEVVASGLFENGRFVEGMCAVQRPKEIGKNTVEIIVANKTSSSELLNEKVSVLRIKNPATGESVEVSYGHSSPLSWIPLPILGCFTINTGHECTFMFWRSRYVSLEDDEGVPLSAETVVAKALSLSPLLASRRSKSQ